jgi:hypothetical protein
VYCGGIDIDGNASVTFLPGIYAISGGELAFEGSARIFGRHVGFYIMGDARVEFTGNATVDLGGPRTGPLAGLLLFQQRVGGTVTEHRISANNVRNLTGTIYMPRGILRIGGNNRVAEGSAYTAVVVRRLRVEGAADLVINTDYGSTDVPVPAGLGRTTTEMRPRLAR